MDVGECTDEGAGGGIVRAELTRVGVLDQIRLAPRVGCGDAGVQASLGS